MFRFPPRPISSFLILPVLSPATSELGGGKSGKWCECERQDRDLSSTSPDSMAPAYLPWAVRVYCLRRQVKSCGQDSCTHAASQAGLLEMRRHCSTAGHDT